MADAPLPPRPPDRRFNYVPPAAGFKRPRTHANRREQWSRYHLVVGAGFGPQWSTQSYTEAAQQLFDQRLLLGRTIDDIFNNINMIRHFMVARNVANAQPPGTTYRPREPAIGAFLQAGDRFDATHVADHQYSYGMEQGGRFHRPHANIDYDVLHDSAFQVDRERFVEVFREAWNMNVQHLSTQRALSRDYHIAPDRSISVWITGRSIFGGMEYDRKNTPEAGAWSRPNSRADPRYGSQPARPAALPVGAPPPR